MVRGDVEVFVIEAREDIEIARGTRDVLEPVSHRDRLACTTITGPRPARASRVGRFEARLPHTGEQRSRPARSSIRGPRGPSLRASLVVRSREAGRSAGGRGGPRAGPDRCPSSGGRSRSTTAPWLTRRPTEVLRPHRRSTSRLRARASERCGRACSMTGAGSTPVTRALGVSLLERRRRDRIRRRPRGPRSPTSARSAASRATGPRPHTIVRPSEQTEGPRKPTVVGVVVGDRSFASVIGSCHWLTSLCEQTTDRRSVDVSNLHDRRSVGNGLSCDAWPTDSAPAPTCRRAPRTAPRRRAAGLARSAGFDRQPWPTSPTRPAWPRGRCTCTTSRRTTYWRGLRSRYLDQSPRAVGQAPGKSVSDRIRRMIVALFDFAAAHHELHHLLFHEAGFSEDDAFTGVRKWFTDLIDEGVETGELRVQDVPLACGVRAPWRPRRARGPVARSRRVPAAAEPRTKSPTWSPASTRLRIDRSP